MSKATLTDWAWVETMIFQSLLGVTTVQVIAFGLSERACDWVVTFFVNGKISEELRSDLVEMPGEAEAALEQVSEAVSNEAMKPIVVEIEIIEKSVTYSYLREKVDRPLFWLKV